LVAYFLGTVFWNTLLKERQDGGIEVRERRGRRSKQLLDESNETKGYWKLKEGAFYRTLWRTRFGKGYGLVRQTAE
jgi:hypothetical protein